MGPRVVRDPVTGKVAYEWVPSDDITQSYVASAIDYDLADEQPWASYSITNDNFYSGNIFITRL